MIPRPAVTFGARLRALRLARGIQQQELAARVDARLRTAGGRGFGASYLSRVERDLFEPPSMLAVELLADELGADRFDLVALAGHVPPALERLFVTSPGARQFHRAAVGLNLSDADWAALLDAAQSAASAGSLSPGT